MNKMAGFDYRKSLQHFGQRLGVGDFLDWWLGELSAMARQFLPGASGNAMEHRVLVKISGSLVTFSQVVHGKVAEAGRLDMSSLNAVGQKQAFQSELGKISRQQGEVVLYLPQEQVLSKKLSLPLAAEENLRQVIAFEMDRHTPFNAGQVYFDYRLVQRGEQLEILLAVAPRDAVDEPLRQLAAWGAQASAVLVADDTTDNVPLNLLPDELRKKSNAMRLPYLNTALAAGAAILFCVALALPIWQKRATVLALHPLLGQAHEQAEAAETLRRQLEALIAEYNYLIDKKRESPPVVAVLDDITRILPDDTWVQQFELKGNEVQIYGETASSSKLAGLFEQSKTLHDASFRAPLTKGQAANSERFQLAAEIKPLPRTAAGHQPAHLAQPAVAQPAADPATLPSQSAIPALPEKDHKSDKQPHEAVKADSKPAAATSGTGSGQAPAARGEKQR